MSASYKLVGVNDVVLRGRSELFQKLVQSLTKPTPANLSLIAPRYMGKTVLLRHLAEHFRPPERDAVVAHWDLRDRVPDDDTQFYATLAGHIRVALRGTRAESMAKYLAPDHADVTDNIDLVVSEGGPRFLVLVDHFDRMTYSSRITKNVWDYLASLARRDNFRFVIASRRRLYDLVSDKDSKTSYFWQLFDSITVPPFEVEVMDDVLVPLVAGGVKFEKGYQRQLIRVTGGHPAIAAALLSSLEDSGVRSVSVEDLAEAGRQLQASSRDLLNAVWDECPAGTQSDLIDLAGDAVSRMKIPIPKQEALKSRGFATFDGQKPSPRCDVMLALARERGGGILDLRSMLASPEAEAQSMRKLLEMKLEAVTGGDKDLRANVLHAIRGLDAGPPAVLTVVRNIAKEGIHVAWKAEFPKGVPSEFHAELTKPRPEGRYGVDHKLLAMQDDVLVRLRLLRAMSGATGAPRLTRRVSRPLVGMLDYVYSVGSFGEHIADKGSQQGAPDGVDLNYCVVVLWAAVSLYKRLAEDCS